MGFINAKIYRLILLAVISLTLFQLSVNTEAKEDLDATAYKLTCPFYQDNRALPTIILYAKKAKPVGVRFELEGVTLHWIGDSLEDIRGIIKTPSAVYDKSTQLVMGNKKITYRSSALDLDGIGFDIDQIKQLVHIRSKVKVVLKQPMKHERGKHHTKITPGKFSISKTRKEMKIEPIKSTTEKINKIDSTQTAVKTSTKKQTDTKTSETEEPEKYDWAGWMWFGILLIIAVVSITILNKKHNKRAGGGISENK